jgi:hypothetical protein
MILTATMLAIAAAQATPAVPDEQLVLQPDLGWLAGYWLSCESGREVSETWSDRRGGVMMGYAIAASGAAVEWEQMRIEGDPASGALSFVAQPRGSTGASFRLVRSAPGEAVFENPAHDFPQRVIYRRDGDRLTGRIEGAGGRAMEWRYAAAPLNARCPAPPR